MYLGLKGISRTLGPMYVLRRSLDPLGIYKAAFYVVARCRFLTWKTICSAVLKVEDSAFPKGPRTYVIDTWSCKGYYLIALGPMCML